MGLTEVKLTIKHPIQQEKATTTDFLVDSGAAYTVIPFRVVQKLGLTPSFEREFTLADGKKIKRKIGSAVIRFGTEEISSAVILGEKGDNPLLGALTLEAFGFALDPFQRKLYKAKMML